RAGDDRDLLARERDVRAAARADVRNLRLRMELFASDAICPHAGRVHDVVGADLEAAPARAVFARDPARAAVLVHELEHVAAVRDDGTEALCLAEDGENEPDVVGLAVVEEVAGARLARG